jgi:small-conductance mechanosensitive channel
MFAKAWEANDLQDLAMALAAAAATLLVIALVRLVLGRTTMMVATRGGAAVAASASSAIDATRLWLLAPVALQVGASLLELPAGLERALGLLAVAGLVLQAGVWGSRMARDWIERKTRDRTATSGDELMTLALLGFAARVAIWTIALLVLLDQLGFNITALVTGLGIGGVAIALAVQNILGDLFASLSIVLDKPFSVGDFIVVDSLSGTVERVGIKTTRVRSLGGEVLVFSNSDLLKSRIRNFSRLRERRVVFTIGVAYETPAEKLRAMPQMLRDAVSAQPRTRFDRAHFKEYGDSALVHEVVYFVLDPDFNTYMDIQHAINLALFERFAAEKIGIAYPTRTVHVAGAPWAVAAHAAAAVSPR